jgi:hypothetical protein
MNWKHEVEINKTVGLAMDEEDFLKQREMIAAVFKTEAEKLPPSLSVKFKDFACEIAATEDEDELNGVLDEAYDFADVQAIWMGV